MLGVFISQAGLIDIEGSHPQIPTSVTTDNGTAIPIANNIEILGDTVANGTFAEPVWTTASGKTVEVNVQVGSAIAGAPADKFDAGLVSFDNTVFAVDANGYVTFVGGGPGVDSIGVDANTAPGTDPVLPNGAGTITVTGGQVASGIVGTNVIRTNSTAANAYTIEIQRATEAGIPTVGSNGICHFDSNSFSVDTSGFVTLLGGGQAIDSVAVQTGTSPVVPDVNGLLTINGAVVAAGTNPVRSDGTGANTLAIEIQTSQALAGADATKIGLCNFDSASFAVAATGFVTASGTGLLKTLTGNTGGAISPTAGNINITGAGSITVAGSGSTLTPQLTGLTANTILLGAGTSTINPLANSTTGNLLVANTGADPGWSSTLAGSFTLSKAASGADVSFNVINTSNTASSTAAIITQVAGSTASDAYHTVKISGGQEWTWGLDNSDSDAFSIAASAALGTTNIMRASTAGEINYPLQPAFLAINTSSTTNNTGDGTAYTLIFGTESFDQNGDFDGTSTFTAPVTGKYQFNCMCLTQNLAATSTLTLTLNIAGTSAKTYRFGNTSEPMTAAGNQPIGFSILVPMTATDTATVVLTVSGGAKTVGVYGTSADPRTTFSGYLVA